MRFVFLSHSVVSDWNHGNAHFQRGILRELIGRGHQAVALEPVDGWSRRNLIEQEGAGALQQFARDFPKLTAVTYRGPADVEAALDGADVVVVHEWTDPQLVAAIGRRRARGADFTLLFHDTHHRAISAPDEMAAIDLDGYDGVLAFGEALSETYRRQGWGRSVHTWHEAADTRLFQPLSTSEPRRDLVWIGNWGDGERTEELAEYLIGPVRAAGLSATVHGVRYPDSALRTLAEVGIEHGGWLRNARVPTAFAQYRMTVHVPRRYYARQLPGIPTIRVFEALACGIPLVSAPWEDAEGLFRPGVDYLVARSGDEMAARLRQLRQDADLRTDLARHGLATVRARHTCAHRVDELFGILGRIAPTVRRTAKEAAE